MVFHESHEFGETGSIVGFRSPAVAHHLIPKRECEKNVKEVWPVLREEVWHLPVSISKDVISACQSQ